MLRHNPSRKKLRDNPCDTHLDTLYGAIDFWRSEGSWPKEYLASDPIAHLLATSRSTPSLRRKRSAQASQTATSARPSDQRPRHEKSALYQDARYNTLLETKKSFIHEDKQGPSDISRDACQVLLAQQQDRIDGKNEAKVIQDITRLIVPSAEELADSGAEVLGCLVEAVNEGWNNAVPVTKTRPQPDNSVGFKRNAFSDTQHEKLSPFIGDFIAGAQSYFMATYYMYFPFLTCEVKCGAAALDIADRQNAHSMTLAVRGVVELFWLARREDEINREILAFSISHDHRTVRIYGYYAVLDGLNTSFYRYPIREFSFQELDGRERWTAYKFIKGVFKYWMPMHFARLCSAIDHVPSGVDFDVPPLQQNEASVAGESIEIGTEDRRYLDESTLNADSTVSQQSASKRQKGK
ncbi:hypothetical protein P153DRAFT_401720 [Dothidotthia symphoricarpi CBS 119687]|uniref:DUF7924 domain-containing protein n=1 Tax=Dothidotthia symphoricarpi CBS 119687 TaxID=1392245 RepID=A0A6A5ZYG6_9PLEO|nr:uncharacterized protein P153DRAFT_401720 [Dothidotthia symphoricarpi CBS 119687]KAF2123827.1 hypothetical protein P153DRAFT_401720 [Dothidotthia symphoricarpi CBS 119687]